MRILRKLAAWRTGRAIRSAEREGDSSRLAELLADDPELRDDFLERASRAMREGDAWLGMLYCLALVRSSDLGALRLLRPLVTRHGGDELWRDLRNEEALELARFVKRHQPEVYDELLSALDDDCFQAIGIELGKNSTPWLRLALRRERFWVEACDRLASGETCGTGNASQVGDDSMPTLRAHLADLQAECLDFVEHRPLCRDVAERTARIEDMVRRIKVLSTGLDQAVDPRLLELLAGKAKFFTPTGLVPVAQLLCRNPSAVWVSALRQAWLRMDEMVRCDTDRIDGLGNDIAPELELAGFTITTAMGACSAQDREYQDFAADEAFTEDLREIERERNPLVERYNQLVGELLPRDERDDSLGVPASQGQPIGSKLSPSGEQSHRADLRDLAGRIRDLDERLDCRHREVRERYSAGYFLRRILGDAQRYSVTVRQGAAWAIYHLCTEGHLTAECRGELLELLRSVIHDENGRDFRERRLYLLPEPCQMEMVQTLQDGVGWMLAIAENPELGPPRGEQEEEADDPAPEGGDPCQGSDGAGGEAPEPADAEGETARAGGGAETVSGGAPTPARETIEDYDQLPTVVRLLWEKLPRAVTFFQQHPLRLLRLDDHSTLLGLYVENGCQLEYWTRFQPPKNVGKVEARYLRIDDRTTPNSMGIFYGLFRHPLLAVPVLRHEYLHYAGVEDEPGEGIGNEMEVRLRETLFARDLFAELAPDRDDQIPAFERELTVVAERLDLVGLLYELLADFEDDERLAVWNRGIVSVYGRALTGEQAERKAEGVVESTNHMIGIQNAHLTWCPRVRWPLLNTGATYALTERYRLLLCDRWRKVHSIDPGQRDAILAEWSSRTARDRWDAYRRRPRATEVIGAACKAHEARMRDEQVARGAVRGLGVCSSGEAAPEVVKILRSAGKDDKL